jgi:hypothetical protein
MHNLQVICSDEYEPKYLALESDKEKRRMMKDLEQELLDEYKDDLKRMTLSEGKILLKLIDRETSQTSYALIKDFRGGVSATFWQGIARLFGSNLKSGYEPQGKTKCLRKWSGLSKWDTCSTKSCVLSSV